MWWYTELTCTIYRPEKTTKKVTKNWNWPLISQQLKILILTLAITLRWFEIKDIIYRPELYNL